MKKLLLCPPTFYDIRYEINPWMKIDNKIDSKKALEEYQTLTYAYKQLNIDFDELEPDEDLPDQVFTTDLGHAEKNVFIKANFKYPERQKEADIAEKYFAEKGYEIKSLPADVYFEGGDLLKIDDTYVFGYGKRSSIEALPYIEAVLGSKIIGVELPDEYYYHLDTCFAPLSKDVALMNPAALTAKGISDIQSHFKTIITTTDEDNQRLANNLVTFEDDVILTQGVSNELKDKLTHLDFRVITVPMVEYIKGGGSVHCVSLEIFE